MQVFSPYISFTEIADCLDYKRLNKQKVEIYQILKILTIGPISYCPLCKTTNDPDYRCGYCDDKQFWKTYWYNHPATKIVKNHELFFIEYGLKIAEKCLKNGWKDTLIPKLKAFRKIFENNDKKPKFWGNEKFHSSHRAALLAKNYEWYKRFGWLEEPKIEYYWPI